jgi:hypothetical protein
VKKAVNKQYLIPGSFRSADQENYNSQNLTSLVNFLLCKIKGIYSIYILANVAISSHDSFPMPITGHVN